ncbi:uncharacterized protein LOC141656946 isoform X2 [Silene latifolia]|uniref:uncharacterized protein LOC141656946 isoform X2 n=1 Tax=Silene latifolia TaxID=37657 RepID=UPI003D772EF0
MAGNGSKKEKRKQRKAQKQAAKSSKSGNSAEEFYSNMNDTLNDVPAMGNAMDGIQRNLIHYRTVPVWIQCLTSLPSVQGKTLAWIQLLLTDEQKTAQLKLYALGSRVALTDDDSDVVERSRKLFKDAAPSFMNDFDLWIFSRSQVGFLKCARGIMARLILLFLDFQHMILWKALTNSLWTRHLEFAVLRFSCCLLSMTMSKVTFPAVRRYWGFLIVSIARMASVRYRHSL